MNVHRTSPLFDDVQQDTKALDLY
ncbi:Protein of unknown function [Lactobacillus helveticus CIRM-BIA 101]|nr:Protein of unknown function [Lactobacillus helveticus CIRM-BIA 101]